MARDCMSRWCSQDCCTEHLFDNFMVMVKSKMWLFQWWLWPLVRCFINSLTPIGSWFLSILSFESSDSVPCKHYIKRCHSARLPIAQQTKSKTNSVILRIRSHNTNEVSGSVYCVFGWFFAIYHLGDLRHGITQTDVAKDLGERSLTQVTIGLVSHENTFWNQMDEISSSLAQRNKTKKSVTVHLVKKKCDPKDCSFALYKRQKRVYCSFGRK